MTECLKCKNNKTVESGNLKVKTEFKCRLSYTSLFMEMHENITNFKCTEFEIKEQ